MIQREQSVDSKLFYFHEMSVTFVQGKSDHISYLVICLSPLLLISRIRIFIKHYFLMDRVFIVDRQLVRISCPFIISVELQLSTFIDTSE